MGAVVEGPVIKGRGLGRGLGFPTANIAISPETEVEVGVYAVRAYLPDGRVVGGTANVGTNPTVGLVETRLEVWLFDFDEDLYGTVLRVELVAFIRPQTKFPDAEALARQVRADAEAARRILAKAE